MTSQPQPRGRELEGRVQSQSIARRVDGRVVKLEAGGAVAEGKRLIAEMDEVVSARCRPTRRRTMWSG